MLYPISTREVENGWGTHYGYDPQFRLSLIDPKTHITLWAFVEHAGGAARQSNRGKNFDIALSKIVSDFRNLTERTRTTASN